MVGALMNCHDTIIPIDTESLEKLDKILLGDLNAAQFFYNRRRES
jgi:hypothetical protein